MFLCLYFLLGNKFYYCCNGHRFLMKISGGIVMTQANHIEGVMLGKAMELKSVLPVVVILQVLEEGEDPQRVSFWVRVRVRVNLEKSMCHHRIGLKRAVLMILNCLTQRH